ncbi:MAG: peptide ABC transporter substrate-binding protein [Pyrinomonadaceae bacterium]
MSFLQKHFASTRLSVRVLFTAAFALTLSCSQIQKPAAEPFYAVTPPPPKQEFRWSNGKMPKSFDPARAAAAPETDVVRAIFEGLTEINSQKLEAVPAAAEKWTSSEDLRVWTFQLRKDARWSNGKRVTAGDFVGSWKRLAGEKTAHRDLIQNIVGLKTEKPVSPAIDATDFQHAPAKTADSALQSLQANSNAAAKHPEQHPAAEPEAKTGEQRPDDTSAPKTIGVVAVNDLTLKVTLELPDKDFPKLVANPIFRPIYGDGKEFETDPLDSGIVTNGAFAVADAGKDGVVLDRSDTYWNKAAVSLEHVRFVPKGTAEAALDSYKKGEIDAVTNADFEPLALKLLAPFEDFRQTRHSALNFYEFNIKNAPFSDRRVREALAIGIDRERLTDGELEGTSQPATAFLPFSNDDPEQLSLDVEKARSLLEKAGYPGGQNFPPIRLVVNRNDTQQRIARTVARMWKQNLNLDTQIIVKETSELEAVKAAGEYDLMRRGVVLPTIDEMACLTSVFGSVVKSVEVPAKETKPGEMPIGVESEPPPIRKGGPSETDPTSEPIAGEPAKPLTLLTEEDAIFELNAIPLYFPMSYSLVKPYVKGFEINGLDAVSLKDVSIDSSWQPR